MTPKNWKNFQHYTDRKPTWIKLHRALLDDYQFSCLPLASQALAPRLWLLASEYEDGKITANLDEMSFRLHVQKNDLVEALKPLVNAEFFIDDSGLLADCYQVAIPEKERETETQVETETENRSLRSRSSEIVSRETSSDWPDDFREKFWNAYPRKTAKKPSLDALDRVRRRGKTKFSDVMLGVSRISCADPQFIPHAKTWITQERWQDEASQAPPRAEKPTFQDLMTFGDGKNGTVASEYQGPDEDRDLELLPVLPGGSSYGGHH